MRGLVLGTLLLPFAGTADAACPDASMMQNAARGWIAGQRLPDPQVRSIEDGLCAYTTFRSVLETELGAPVGVKVGFTSKPVQQSFGIDAPVAGALFAPMLLPDGARVSMKGSRSPFYEADLIATVGSAAIMQAKTREEAAAFLTAEKLVGQYTDAGVANQFQAGLLKIRLDGEVRDLHPLLELSPPCAGLG